MSSLQFFQVPAIIITAHPSQGANGATVVLVWKPCSALRHNELVAERCGRQAIILNRRGMESVGSVHTRQNTSGDAIAAPLQNAGVADGRV